MKVLIAVILIVLILSAFIIYAVYNEYKDFNKGVCPRCGNKLHLFDIDSQGGRGYCCHKCPYFTWISYDCVDKNYKE